MITKKAVFFLAFSSSYMYACETGPVQSEQHTNQKEHKQKITLFCTLSFIIANAQKKSQHQVQERECTIDDSLVLGELYCSPHSLESEGPKNFFGQ